MFWLHDGFRLVSLDPAFYSLHLQSRTLADVVRRLSVALYVCTHPDLRKYEMMLVSGFVLD